MSKAEEGTLDGQRGVEIYWQAWLPDGAPRAGVAIAHGASEHSGRYAHVGERLAAHGYAAYALDHRGHGRSGGDRALFESMGLAVEDLRSFIAVVAERNPGLDVYLLGHSMGGAVALAYALRHQETLSGLMLSGALADAGAAGPATRSVARLLSRLTPKLGIFEVESEGVSRDPQVVRDYDADPLNYHGKLPARTVAEATGAVLGFPEEVPALRLPLLVMHGGADRLTPVEGSRMVHERASSADKTLEIYEGLYHEILNEPERDQVLDDIVAWLDAHAGQSASVAR